MKFKDMATLEISSDTQRDMIASILHSLRKNQKITQKDIFGDITSKDLQDLINNLNKYRDDLEKLFNTMREELIGKDQYLTDRKYQWKDAETDILTQIQRYVAEELDKRRDVMTNEKLLDISEFFETKAPNLDKNLYKEEKQKQAIQNFIKKYSQLKGTILDTYETIGNISEAIRGDKMYYGILLEKTTSDPKIRGKDAAKLIKLSREQFDKFERDNQDLFELNIRRRQWDKDANEYKGSEGTARRVQLREGISSIRVYERMRATFGTEWQEEDVLDQIYAVNNQNQAVKTRDIYKILFGDTLSKHPNYAGITPGRKLELLFDENFRQTVTNYINNEENYNLATSMFNRKELITKLKEFNASKYHESNAENIYGQATGDVNFNLGNGNEAWQLKFKGRSRPWNGVGIQGAIDALSVLDAFYNTISTSDMDNITNDALRTKLLTGFGLTEENLMMEPRFNKAFSEMGYEVANNVFQSTFDKTEFTIVGFA